MILDIKIRTKIFLKNQNIKIIKNDLNQKIKINDLNHLANPGVDQS